MRAPALDPVAVWRVEQVHDAAAQFTPIEGKFSTVYVREKLQPAQREPAATTNTLRSVVIVGGGGASNAAAEVLRQEGYTSTITMLSADSALPYDRPKLSKRRLGGMDDATVTPPRSMAFYKQYDIYLRLSARVCRIDTASKQVELEDGSRHGYGVLLLATGADPVRLDIPGGELPHVHYLRTLADCEALIGSAKTAKRAVVIGASFIGLEVAASLRARKLVVDVVGREAVTMVKVLSIDVRGLIRRMHQRGVTFHHGASPALIGTDSVTLDSGERLDANLVVIDVGVKPNLTLAKEAGLAIDRSVTVDAYLQTSVAGIYAGGDIARWPDRLTGESIRVEDWVVAECQDQTAARNMLGLRERFDAVPFFWTEQYDFGLAYDGHAESFDKLEIDGDLDKRDCKISYSRKGRRLAAAFVHRDLGGLRTEVEFERAITRTFAAPRASEGRFHKFAATGT